MRGKTNEKEFESIDDFEHSFEKDTEDPSIYRIIFRENGFSVEQIKIKYCGERNLCRIYNPETNLFDEDELMNFTLVTVSVEFPADSILWYCTNDLDFALRHGFKNPYFCNRDVFMEKIKYRIAVSRANDPHFKTNDKERHNGDDKNPEDFQKERTSPKREYKKTMFNFTKKNLHNNDPIKLEIKFDKGDLIYLQELVYTGKTDNGDGNFTQKEISGLLHLEKNEKGEGFTLKIDKTKNFNAHDEDKVRFVNGMINFHTHPHEVYVEHEINMMYPSPADYTSILIFMLQKHNFEEDDIETMCPLLFSVVVTAEGLYIISLNKNYCGKGGKDVLREEICDRKSHYYDLKPGISRGINSKEKNVSGYYYGKDRNPKNFYTTHCNYIGDPEEHPLGCTQVGGYDYDTYEHNRTSDQLLKFGNNGEKNKELAAKDYCLKINKRELLSGVEFGKGPVIHVQFFTYENLEKNSFNIYTGNTVTDFMPPQLFLNEETINDIALFRKTESIPE
jgi:hypothetical protein